MGADAVQSDVVWMRLVEQVDVHVDNVLSSDGVGSIRLSLLSHSFGHEPVQHAHVDVDGSELDADLPQALEAEPRSVSVQFEEAPVIESNSEVLAP